MEALVIPNVYGLVRPESGRGRILLQERWKPDRDPENSGKLELPGGKWDAFESMSDCLRREIAEETGLTVTNVDQLTSSYGAGNSIVEVTPVLTVAQMVKGPYPSVLMVLSCSADGEPLSQGDGSRNARWWDLEEAETMLRHSPDAFTALTLAVLTSLSSSDVLHLDGLPRRPEMSE